MSRRPEKKLLVMISLFGALQAFFPEPTDVMTHENTFPKCGTRYNLFSTDFKVL